MKHNADSAIIAELIVESSNKLRDLFGLSSREVISKPFPRIVTRKDLSLDNYFADLMLRACYKKEDRCPEFEEIVIRGSNEDIPSNLNPQIKGAVLIGIGGISERKNRNKEFITAYDEHFDQEGKRSVDSASQVVFFRHLERYKKLKPGVSSILPVLNEVNEIDSQGGAGENHLNQMVKDLHLCKFYRRGFIVEEYPPQWKRAIVEAILVSVCLKNKELKRIDLQEAARQLREIWKEYRRQRERAVSDGVLMPLSADPNDAHTAEVIFNKALGRTASDMNERGNYLFTLKRILFAVEDIWGKETAYFVTAFLLETKLQLTAEFYRTSKMTLDETYIPEAQCSLIYYVMSQEDMKPHRGIGNQLNNGEKSGIIVVKDLHRYTTAIFKSGLLESKKWARFTEWLQDEEPGRWYIPVSEKKGLAEFILNGTRYYLGSEPSSLTKEDISKGIKKTCV
jgi:hypothetical protein